MTTRKNKLSARECESYSVLRKGDKSTTRLSRRKEKVLSTEKGDKSTKECQPKDMQKLLSTEEGRQKHNRMSAETMQKFLQY